MAHFFLLVDSIKSKEAIGYGFQFSSKDALIVATNILDSKEFLAKVYRKSSK